MQIDWNPMLKLSLMGFSMCAATIVGIVVWSHQHPVPKILFGVVALIFAASLLGCIASQVTVESHLSTAEDDETDTLPQQSGRDEG